MMLCGHLQMMAMPMEDFLEILRLVDAVTCDNPYGLTFASSYNLNGFLVPDPAQVEEFDQFRGSFSKPKSPLVLGWIGSPFMVFNLFVVWEALEIVFSRHKEIQLKFNRDRL